MTTVPLVPVAAVPVKGPQLSLLVSSVAPASEGDHFALGDEVLSLLPLELQVELRAREGDDWTRGFSYLPENQSAAIARSPYDTATVDNPESPANLPLVSVIPVSFVTKFTHSSFGNEAIDFIGRATRQNDAAIHAAIGREFWEGTIAQAAGLPNNYLNNADKVTDLTPTPGTAVSVTEGMGILQDALSGTNGAGSGGFGGQGMIHLIPRAVPSLLSVRRVGKFLLDIFDNIVVPDPGYTGTGPGGEAPSAGTTWIYATDLVMTRVESSAYVTPDSMAEALDRGQDGNPNTFTWRASRFGCAYFDGFRQFGVLVNLPS